MKAEKETAVELPLHLSSFMMLEVGVGGLQTRVDGVEGR